MRWSEEQIENNNNIEKTMIFSNFSAIDLGIGRQLVCTLNRNNIDYEKNAKLIEVAPELYDIVIEFIESSKLQQNGYNDELIKKAKRIIKSINKK